MARSARHASEILGAALARAPREIALVERKARRLLVSAGAFDRFVPERLLLEALSLHLESAGLEREPVVLFLDFAGGGDGARAAASIIALLGTQGLGGTFVHAAGSTPPRGLGALVRTSLVSAGAGAGILVDVVAHDHPLGAVEIPGAQLAALAAECALVVSYAPGGVGALLGQRAEGLLGLSHVGVVTFPDPESFVADLGALGRAIDDEPGMDGALFRVEVEAGDAGGTPGFVELGRCTLGPPDGDAGERLWQLVDNAKRWRYRIVVEPTAAGRPVAAPLVCPCRRVLERGSLPGMSVSRIVPSGSRLVAVGRGRATLA
ncbi:MAG: hypothetical protein M0R80_21905 [Proteobacteria bacterium]|jgi:hypothetical protein|nr:hypothetical protein [Pseudomonadota bacterium]